MNGLQKRPDKSPFGGKASPQTPSDTSRDTPIFSFEFMKSGSGYSVTCCDATHRAALAAQLFLLSQKTWLEIQQAPRHGQGAEKIPRSSIKAPIDRRVTEEVRFLALRYYGRHPMVGFRDGRTFNIMYIDHTMDVYPHS